MEYWEFLLQKEGERSWQPLNSKRIEVATGRYRVVAHTSRNNTDVEICVTHTNTQEVPPKRRSQKRSRRTNPEGLMVVIPFTHLKPGLWELRCCGDIMSDFLGKSWQQAIQLQVLAKPTEVLSTAPQPEIIASHQNNGDIAAEVKPAIPEIAPEILVSHQNNGDIAAEVKPAIPEIAPEILVSNQNNGDIAAEVKPAIPEIAPEILVSHQNNGEASQPMPVDSADFDPLMPFELAELDENQAILNSDLNAQGTSANPILEQSLQMLEQILQQVLEPVMQELDPAESSEAEPVTELEETAVTPEQDMLLERQGFILTLEQDAYTAQRGEPLTITGHIDILDVNQVGNSETADLNAPFRGSLRYQLRDPQTSQILLDVQQPLPAESLPLAFNHTLEIPPDCKTRLILGKVTLFGSTPGALTSQPFTITADLDELLGAILPGTKIMPVAKMLVLANQFASLQDNEAALEQLTEASLTPTVIDLIDTRPSLQPPPLQPALGKALPPQIYQPIPTPKGSKSLNLPNFPKMPPAAASKESTTDEVKPEEALEQPVALVEDSNLTTAENTLIGSQSQEVVSQDETLKADAASTLDAIELDSSVSGIDSTWEPSEQVNAADAFTPVIVSQPDDLETLELWDTPEPQIPAAEVQSTQAMTDELKAVDDAFPALNIQDRFWSRLNSLAADAELSQWLKSDVSSPPNSSEMQEMTSSPPYPLLNEVEEVTQSLNSEGLITDFDESIWEQTERFGGNFDDTEQREALQPPPIPPLPENPPIGEKASLQLSQVGVGNTDWAAQEIVVEDEDEDKDEESPVVEQTPAQPNTSRERQPTKQFSSKLEPILPTTIQAESPLPAPTICVATTELAAGEPITVRVKLPNHSARLCVKLWVQDRQSRYLLDGPRWLVDLLPDGAGQLEAMTQVVIPFGSAEIRMEAIAIDLDSQRESHKVTVDCVVVPPDLPGMSLDEFEV